MTTKCTLCTLRPPTGRRRAGVQEPLLLVNRSSCRSDISTLPGSLAGLDRGHLDARACSSSSGVRCRHPGVAGALSRRQPERTGSPPPQFRRPGGHPAELLVGPPLLARAHPALGLVLQGHVVDHHRHHVLTSSPVWPVIKTTNGNPPNGRATEPARTFPRKRLAEARQTPGCASVPPAPSVPSPIGWGRHHHAVTARRRSTGFRRGGALGLAGDAAPQ